MTSVIEIIEHHLPIFHSPCRCRSKGPLPSCFSGNTPLMYAIAEGHDQVVDALLKAGADVEAGWPAKKAAK